MHELSIAQGLVDAVVDYARREGFARARVLHLELGAFSAVMPEALEFGFASVAAGTAAEGAELRLRRVPGRGRCAGCGHDGPVETRPALCPACGEHELDVSGGGELRLVELEIEGARSEPVSRSRE